MQSCPEADPNKFVYFFFFFFNEQVLKPMKDIYQRQVSYNYFKTNESGLRSNPIT